MSERLRVAEQFIKDYGQNAARALEELPPDIAGSLIDTIADPLSVSSLRAMLPYHAAKCLGVLPAAAAARYLAGLSPREAAAILRHLDDASRRNLVDLMPRQLAVRVALVLNFPQSLVGAWMDPLALSLPLTISVSDARSRIAKEGCNHETIFLVDEGNRVRGAVSLVRLLLQSQEDTGLSVVADEKVTTISASMTIERAFASPGWGHRDLMPVLDRNDRFIGVLRYADLRQALSRPSLGTHVSEADDDLLAITEVCYLGLADLMSTALGDESDAAGRT